MSTGERTASDTTSWGLAAAVCAPGIAMLCAITTVLAAAAFSWHPLWRDEPLTLAEAVALRDQAIVARLIEAGADPTQPSKARPGVLNQEADRLLPLEAAVAAKRPEMLGLLFELGARVGPHERQRLFCFAQRLGDRDVLEELARLTGQPPAPLDCASIETPR